MARVSGPTLKQLDSASDRFAGMMRAAIKRTLKKVSSEIRAASAIDDLTVISDVWQDEVTENLMPGLHRTWTRSVDDVHDQLQRTANSAARTAAVEPGDNARVITKTADEAATEYLATRQNFLTNVGDDVWEVLRDELIVGIEAGEGIDELRDRITTASSIAEPRAVAVARTEAINAANAGSLQQMRDSGLTATKEWVATSDSRVRKDHHDADGQIVGLGEPFTVGGFAMDRPGDGPASQVVNCRCTLSYNIPDDAFTVDEWELGDLPNFDEDDADLLVAGAVTAAADVHTGAMIALIPSESDLDRIALDDGEPKEQLHLTLWYLGEADEIPEDMREKLIGEVQHGLSHYDELENRNVAARGFGINHWNPNKGEDAAWVMSVGDNADIESLSLNEVHGIVMDALANAEFNGPDQFTPWVPHVTLGYGLDASRLPDMEAKLGDLTFDRLRFAFAGEYHDITLSTSDSVTAAGGGAMPWSKVEGHADCDGEPWAVVKDGEEDVAVGCHATEEEADAQIAALEADESDDDGDDDDPFLSQNVTAAGEGETAPWSGVLVVEGVTTGDGREFMPEALEWADLPLPLRWNREDSHGGEPRTVAVNVGRIDTMRREGNQILATGVFNLGSEHGREAYQLVEGQFLRGVSVDVDDIADADIEMIFPESDDDDEGSPLDALFLMPEKIIFHGGRVRAATLCDIPAFVEAFIQLDDAAEALVTEEAALAAAAAAAPPWKNAKATTVIDDRPPREWFDDPKFSVYTPIIVTDDGRVYGHAAPWGQCHIGIEDVCVEPPHEDTHPYYMTGEVVTSDGNRVAVGQITVGTGHAPLHLGASRAVEHYDNTGAAVADVTVGNDAHGIWVAGSIRPHADAARVRDLRAAGQVSGDWRRIGGQLRLVGLLAVNVPGFPVPKLGARVAAGAPQSLVAAGRRAPVRPQFTEDQLVQLGLKALKKRLIERVRNGGK